MDREEFRQPTDVTPQLPERTFGTRLQNFINRFGALHPQIQVDDVPYVEAHSVEKTSEPTSSAPMTELSPEALGVVAEESFLDAIR